MNWLEKALYQFFLIVYVLICFPKWLWAFLYHGKYKESFTKRFAITFNNFSKKNELCIWIHAASFGEAKAANPLCKLLREKYPKAFIVFSSVTETGFNEVKKHNPYISRQLYLPLDFSWSVKRLVKAIEPDLFILIESEFWPNLLNELKQKNCPIFLVNGKLSDTSFRRFKKIPFLQKLFFDPINHFCVQDRAYFDRFVDLGIAPSKLSITGNLKYDIEDPILTSLERENLKKRLGILEHQKVITIGSTHNGEEALLLNALKNFLRDRNYKIILAPRHPERIETVKTLMQELHIHYLSYSNLKKMDRLEKIILIDQMGVLNNCYQISDVAIVGGSFVQIGGHNLLEPARYGIPTFFGPHTFNQKEMKMILLKNNLGFESNVKQIALLISKFLEESLGNSKDYIKALNVMKTLKGASKKSLDELVRALELRSHKKN